MYWNRHNTDFDISFFFHTGWWWLGTGEINYLKDRPPRDGYRNTALDFDIDFLPVWHKVVNNYVQLSLNLVDCGGARYPSIRNDPRDPLQIVLPDNK